MEYHLQLPLTEEDRKKLKPGDMVYLTGILYSARDAAHKRMTEEHRLPPESIYYMGPSPAREGRPIGSAGPTTAGRMDAYTPALLDQGLRLMIGKGKRTEAVRQAMIRNQAVYVAVIGGAGALLSGCITDAEIEAYPELGPEAIYKLTVREFPGIVVIDHEGAVYETYL